MYIANYDEGRMIYEDRLRNAEQARFANQFHQSWFDQLMARLSGKTKQQRPETE